MASGTNFPASLDSFNNKIDGVDDILATETNTQSSAIEQLQAKVGIDSSADTDSLDYKVNQQITNAGAINGYVLVSRDTETNGIKWEANPAGFPDPTTTRGDLITRDESNIKRLPLGSNGEVVSSDGTDLIYQSMQDLTSSYVGEVRSRLEPTGVTLPTMPSYYQSANGALVSDSDSPYNGKRLPNLNGGDVTLTLTFTADAGGAYATIDDADKLAVGMHDWASDGVVSIEANSYVKSIDYSTGVVIISDTTTSGSVTVTFSNEGRSLVGGAFDSVGDQMQRITGHTHSMRRQSISGDDRHGALYASQSGGKRCARDSDEGRYIHLAIDSSLSPNARTGAETWDKTKTDAYKAVMYIRIK